MPWHEVCEADAVGDDEALATVIGAHKVAVCRSAGGLYAVANVCTHQYALLSDGFVEDGCIECPLHQARFDLKTGAAVGAPATEPVRVFTVKTERGKVYVEVPE